MKVHQSLPQMLIKIGDKLLKQDELRALVSVRVQQQLSQPTQCELVFSEALHAPNPLEVSTNTPLEVGVQKYETSLFIGEVTAVEHHYATNGQHNLHIRGYDLLHRLRKRQSLRSYVNVTPKTLAQELTVDLGLDVKAADAGATWPYLLHYHPSDWEFLIDIAQQSGLHISLAENTLYLHSLKGYRQEKELQLGSDLLEARVEENFEAAINTISTQSWNPLDTSDESTYEFEAGLDNSNIPTRQHTRFSQVTQNQEQAERLAEAELAHWHHMHYTLWGSVEGNPSLKSGTPVKVQGLGKSLPEKYVLTNVIHTIDATQGFLSEIDSKPPKPYQQKTTPNLAFGIVSQVSDPEKQGRVRVILPAQGGVESTWLHVMQAGAGDKKGFATFPEIDDKVLILFPTPDPSQGIVLGGLYGPAEIPESHIEIAKDKLTIYASTDLEISAPGKKITIKGQEINFEKE